MNAKKAKKLRKIVAVTAAGLPDVAYMQAPNGPVEMNHCKRRIYKELKEKFG